MAAEQLAAEAWAYAERIRKALPVIACLLRKRRRLSMYGLWKRSKVARQTVSEIEDGECMSNLFTLALIAFVVAGSLTEFARHLDGHGERAAFHEPPSTG